MVVLSETNGILGPSVPSSLMQISEYMESGGVEVEGGFSGSDFSGRSGNRFPQLPQNLFMGGF
jgi:hypothetical protein